MASAEIKGVGRDERVRRWAAALGAACARTCSMLTAASSRSRAASASRSTLTSEVMLAMACEALAESSSFCSTKSVTLLMSPPSRLLPVASSSSSASSTGSRGVSAASERGVASPPFLFFFGLMVAVCVRSERAAKNQPLRTSGESEEAARALQGYVRRRGGAAVLANPVLQRATIVHRPTNSPRTSATVSALDRSPSDVGAL